ncbi:DUF177 domain-containing protein [Sphingomonas lacunae]|uniref:DUF177 domain-containing protein n=1 Tax=Sphingomonas lacunae TaxID=2698828 RepID=A0A6M4ARN6_9SPHN|nr:DUF177 domain-containing protein [Sphingomonas lacunae]QJQ31715.1 DUF177 domain-containing protein [Sphingomonas lacunae]
MAEDRDIDRPADAPGDAGTTGEGFHRLITAAEARRLTGPLEIVANADERVAVATRFDLVALDRFEARLELVCDGEDLVVSGSIDADVVQRCVATDLPLPVRVESTIAVRYVPLARLEAAENEAEIELGEQDLDIIGVPPGTKMDLGDMLSDSLYLALYPFPRHPDADTFLKERGVQSEAEAGAFGALAALRDKLSGPE